MRDLTILTITQDDEFLFPSCDTVSMTRWVAVAE